MKLAEHIHAPKEVNHSDFSIEHFGPEQHIRTTTGQIVVNFAVDIDGPQKMIPHDFSDSMPEFCLVTNIWSDFHDRWLWN